MRASADQTTAITEDVPSLAEIATADQAFTAMRLHTYRGIVAVVRGDVSDREAAWKRVESARARVENAFQAFEALPRSAAEAELYAPLPQLFREYLTGSAAVWELSRAGDATPRATRAGSAASSRG
ncbi:MAG TPA: Tar ligand binding domain-containing protein [Anaeromyxobacter sp.]|nr:Tar ligand binding domain-containing protein [Anaeromyxobacter sp.]